MAAKLYRKSERPSLEPWPSVGAAPSRVPAGRHIRTCLGGTSNHLGGIGGGGREKAIGGSLVVERNTGNGGAMVAVGAAGRHRSSPGRMPRLRSNEGSAVAHAWQPSWASKQHGKRERPSEERRPPCRAEMWWKTEEEKGREEQERSNEWIDGQKDISSLL